MPEIDFIAMQKLKAALAVNELALAASELNLVGATPIGDLLIRLLISGN